MKRLYFIIVICCTIPFISCGGEDYHGIELVEEVPKDNGILISDSVSNERDSILGTKEQPSNGEPSDTQIGKKYLVIEEYASGIIKHQSAACYGNYAFFLLDAMKKVQMYNIQKKQEIFTLTQTSLGQASIYHCNQSCFGKEKFHPEDPFPLLYVSMFQASGRCSAMVYRILPNKNTESDEYDSFSLELVQRIYYPKVSDANALYNVNAVIDTQNNFIYTYSRNNNSNAENYMKCRVSKFPLPDPHSGNVTFENDDILDSFELNVSAANTQGGTLDGNLLYIMRGYPGAGYVYLYIIDINEKRIKYIVDLFSNGFYEEPEGVFFHNDTLYTSTSSGKIYRFLFKTKSSSAKTIAIPYDLSE